MTKEQAYHAFLSGFTWKAYDENTVPDDAPMPRITYEFAFDDFDHPVFLTVSFWDRSTSWASVTNKVNEVSETIGRGGKMLHCDGGAIWITRGSPFAQRLADEDESVRRIMININAEFLTA